MTAEACASPPAPAPASMGPFADAPAIAVSPDAMIFLIAALADNPSALEDADGPRGHRAVWHREADVRHGCSRVVPWAAERREDGRSAGDAHDRVNGAVNHLAGWKVKGAVCESAGDRYRVRLLRGATDGVAAVSVTSAQLMANATVSDIRGFMGHLP